MSKSTKPPIWQLPAIIVSGLGLLGLLGTWAVSYATYAELPKKVERVVEKNEEQDTAIDKLTALQEYYAKQVPNQQQTIFRQISPQIREYDATDERFWCCDEGYRESCYRNKTWYEC